MRYAFCILIAANLLLIAAAYPFAPDNFIPMFGFDGAPRPDVVFPKAFYFLGMAAIPLSLGVAFWLVDLITPILPAFIVRFFAFVPHAEYWTREENRPKMHILSRRFASELVSLVVVFNMLFFVIVFYANMIQPKPLGFSPLFLTGVYTIVLFAWVIRLFLAFRIPKENVENPESK